MCKQCLSFLPGNAEPELFPVSWCQSLEVPEMFRLTPWPIKVYHFFTGPGPVIAMADDVEMQAVAPGQLLGNEASNVSVGRGAYLEGGQVYAALAGQLRRSETSLEVVMDGSGSGEALVPTVGATVLARVVRLQQDRAECIIVAVGDLPLSEKFRGIIRKQDVRFFELTPTQTSIARLAMRSPLRFAQGLDRDHTSVLNSSDRDDPTELSEVSFLSRDRDFVDQKHFSDDSDEDDHLQRRRQTWLGYAMACCGLCALFALVLLFHSFSGSSSSTLWTSATAWGSPSEDLFEAQWVGGGCKDFVDLGEGLCMGVQRELIPKYNSSNPLELFSEMSASECESRCRSVAKCSGFVTTSATSTRCSLEDGFPAAADGNSSFRCFWRHNWLHNSVGIYDSPQPSVPKLIWTYWENLHQETGERTMGHA
eukprot:s224_g9.t1